MDKVKLVALGGLDEDGKDLYVVEINDKIFVIGGGFKYPTKLTPGIDFIIADFSYLEERKDKIVAYFLPKTKQNIFGAIPYIYKKCPAKIYCTELTGQQLLKFSIDYNVENNFKFDYVNPPETKNISGYEVTFFSTCASMPLTFGFSIKTNLGNIVYSGDFIVEYNNEKFFKLDLNTLGKIAEEQTLILLSESQNSGKNGYCSPNHRLYPFFKRCFDEANGRCFVALTDDNLYHIDELCNACNEYGKKVIFYDESTKNIFNKNSSGKFLPSINQIPIDDIFRNKENDLVILITADPDRLYEKISLLATGENELKQVKINPNDTFILAVSPSDNMEVVATSTIDEVYKTGCHVKYIKKKSLYKMHACEEDLRMLLSLLKPKYYLPIEGYYVDILNNAKIAFDMKLNLSHRNIFVLDNGQILTLTANGPEIDFNMDEKSCKTGDIMIDGVGVGDVVNEIINDRTRLGNDGVVVLGSAISIKEKKIIAGPDVQMRGFLYLKDKDAELILKSISQAYVEHIENWLKTCDEIDPNIVDIEVRNLEIEIKDYIKKYLIRVLNREPVINPQIIIY